MWQVVLVCPFTACQLLKLYTSLRYGHIHPLLLTIQSWIHFVSKLLTLLAFESNMSVMKAIINLWNHYKVWHWPASWDRERCQWETRMISWTLQFFTHEQWLWGSANRFACHSKHLLVSSLLDKILTSPASSCAKCIFRFPSNIEFHTCHCPLALAFHPDASQQFLHHFYIKLSIIEAARNMVLTIFVCAWCDKAFMN